MIQPVQSRVLPFVSIVCDSATSLRNINPFGEQYDSMILGTAIANSDHIRQLLSDLHLEMDDFTVISIKLANLSNVQRTLEGQYVATESDVFIKCRLAGIFLNIVFWPDFEQDTGVNSFLELLIRLTDLDMRNKSAVGTCIKSVVYAGFHHLFPAIHCYAASNKLDSDGQRKMAEATLQNFRFICKEIMQSDNLWAELCASDPNKSIKAMLDVFGKARVEANYTALILCHVASAHAAAGNALSDFREASKPFKLALSSSMNNDMNKATVERIVLAVIGHWLNDALMLLCKQDSPEAWLVNKLVFLTDILLGVQISDFTLLNAAMNELSAAALVRSTSVTEAFLEELKSEKRKIRSAGFAAVMYQSSLQALRFGKNDASKNTLEGLDSDNFDGSIRSIVKYLSDALTEFSKEKKSRGSSKLIRSRSDEALNRQLEIDSLVSALQDCTKSFNAELLYCVCEYGQDRLQQAESLALIDKSSSARATFLENLAVIGSLTQSLRFMMRERSLTLIKIFMAELTGVAIKRLSTSCTSCSVSVKFDCHQR